MHEEFGSVGGGVSVELEKKKAAAAVKYVEMTQQLRQTSGALKEMSRAVNNTTATVKKSVRSLMKFDEINRLAKKTTVKKSGSKKGSTAKGGGSGSSSKSLSGGVWDSLKQLGSLKWWNHIKEFTRLNSAVKLLASNVKGALKWCYDRVLLPLSKWTLNKGLPSLFRAVGGAVRLFNAEMKALAPIGKLVWEGVLLPLARWQGNAITQTLDKVGEGLSFLYNHLTDLGNFVNGGIIQQIESVLSGGEEGGIMKCLSDFKEKLGSLEIGISFPWKEQFNAAWSNIKDWAASNKTVEIAMGLVKKGWKSVKSWVGEIPMLSAGVGLVKKGWTSVKNWLGTLKTSVSISLVKDGWKTVKSWLGELSAKFNIKLPTVSITWSGSPIKLPHFDIKWNAKGGILTGATLFGMAGGSLLGGGEAGREAVLPLERNTEWMDGLAERLAGRMQTTAPIVVQVTLDGKTVGQSVVNYCSREAKRTGVHPMAAFL